jgi:hypothetical protein
MRLRASIVGLLLVVFLIGAASPASAVITSFEPFAVALLPDTDAAIALGSIRCTGGEVFRVEVNVRQKAPGFYSGKGTDEDVCFGSTMVLWRADVARISGDLVAGVRTRVILVAKSFGPGFVVTDKERLVFFFTA